MSMAEAPVKLWLGPPPPRAITHMTRVLQFSVFVFMSCWLFGYLGGVRLSPRPLAEGGNDTGQLFNWHPLLLTVAFPILMAEAVLAYKAPMVDMYGNRQHSKLYHFGLHTAALVCTVLGVVAAFKSHTLKQPPIPNLYSAHSWMGLTVLTLLAAQYLMGAAAYLWPKLSLASRRALGPIHIFAGKAVFLCGLATMTAGIQEKQTFIQFGAKPGVHTGIMSLPAALNVLLLLTAMAVLFHHTPAAGRQQQQADPGEAVLLITGQFEEQPGTPTFQDSHTA